MGVKIRRTFTLTFDDSTGWPGLEVKVQSLSIREDLQVGELRERTGSDDVAVARAAHVELVRFFSSKILSWNAEDDDGTPVPITEDALLDQEPDLLYAILDAWKAAVRGVAAPLEQSSTGGEPSELASIPTETLPESRAS